MPPTLTHPAILARLGTAKSFLLEAAEECGAAGEKELVKDLQTALRAVNDRITELRKVSDTKPTRHV